MKYLQLTNDTKLKDVASIVGDSNVERLLVANDIERTPNIGKSFIAKCNRTISDTNKSINWSEDCDYFQ